jgi:mannose-6-phosphate isomerase
MSLDGDFEIQCDQGNVKVNKGETILIPASVELFQLKPLSKMVKTLEVYII